MESLLHPILRAFVKLIVQIPAFNEEDSLADAVSSLPRVVEGFDSVEVLVVDDGSTDRTAEVARRAGADEVVRFPVHRGLAAAFAAGLRASLHRGADCIVNFDADSQYLADDIPILVGPILRGEADVVVGDRRPHRIPHFSPAKKVLHAAGSWVVRYASSTGVHDATSGFRAMSRRAAGSVRILSKLTYTVEMLIRAGSQGLRVTSVDVRTNPPKRPSRLIRSTTGYVVVSAIDILRTVLGRASA
jgi:glycosyltransferase involved in cell wall biosynthesis